MSIFGGVFWQAAFSSWDGEGTQATLSENW